MFLSASSSLLRTQVRSVQVGACLLRGGLASAVTNSPWRTVQRTFMSEDNKFGAADGFDQPERPRRTLFSELAPEEQRLRREEQSRCTVFVGNLSYDVQWQDLKDHMKEVGPVEYAEVLSWPDGGSKGCGIVRFSTPEDARNAIEQLNNTEFGGRHIFVREDRQNDPAARKTRQAMPPPPFSLTIASQGDSEVDGEPKDRLIFVGGLPYHVTSPEFRDVFSVCGPIERAEVGVGKDGRSAGYGAILFKTKEAAQAAIDQFHNTKVLGRFAVVKPYKLDN